VTLELQTQALGEFGFYGNHFLDVLHGSRSLYHSDPEYVNNAIYVKYDRTSEGLDLLGSPFKEVQLWSLSGQAEMLSSFVKKAEASGKQLLLLSGSYT